ncbi:MAG: MBL fold metallo-hydrolase [Paramuribaculum sp.]|nr:MBL fold metallo-hydrolase [Paramuribaculum sp.]
MKIKSLEFNLFGVNTYIIWDTDTMETAVIDPGMSDPDECFRFKQFIEDEKLQVTKLINTHLHIDHTLGNEYVENAFGVALMAHSSDAPLGANRAQQAAMFHLRGVATDAVKIGIEIKGGDKIYLGDEYLEVLDVPGHSPGSIALYSPVDKFVITGDALFRGSVGRTDLPGGNHATLIDSIKTNLMTLPADTIVYPGHGPATTIGQERVYNPFLR